MVLDSVSNRDSIAIVVVGYNRIEALKRLLGSLLKAHFHSLNVPLIISIDASGDLELYEYVNSFAWPFGDKYVNIQEERLGLRRHIIQCGDLTKYFKAVVLLEDDLFVSEFFYDYVEEVVSFYDSDERVAGFSLINSEMGFPGLPSVYLQDGGDTFLKQFPASWGECWTSRQWERFKSWYINFTDDQFATIDMPERVKGWKQAWSKYYVAYMVQKGLYFVYPYLSLTTCFGDAGVHASSISSVSQTSLLSGPKNYTFRSFDNMQKYDVYGVNESVYNWIGLSCDELCVDWYGLNLKDNKKYILTTIRLPYTEIRSYGLEMRPIELNIKYDIPGRGIFLYDTTQTNKGVHEKKLPLSVGFYHLRSFNYRLAAKYAAHYYLQALWNKLKFWK